MGFLSLYSGTSRIDLTDRGDPNGYWWVEVKKTLSGAELDIAEGKKLQMTAPMGDPKADKAARERLRREMKGLPPQDDEPPASQSMLHFDTAAYRLELLTLAVTDWNLTDENDRPLPLVPFSAKRRSLKLLPPGIYNTIVARVEENAEASKSTDDEEEVADFRGGGDLGGAHEAH